ncbi:hypothetical protein NPIL_442291 [Nephila pilipes]|uniref:Uncharacterized protein n=1 Tax=Nephila pilipes TaxID=299642 RepID=A0A8X6NIZ5_NEPPI|nr:hypothetical protein NPIL_442291 [Nephila pilipes]
MMKNTKVVSFSKPTRKKGPQYGRLTWKVFKVFALILCIAGFVYQTTEFYAHFRTYPTTTRIEIITPDEFIAPAITFCNKNSIQRRRFCNENPDRCFTMTNITKFCNDHPYYCRDNPSSLVIPHLFPYSNVRIAVTDEDVKKYSQGSWEFSRVSRGGYAIDFTVKIFNSALEVVRGPIFR